MSTVRVFGELNAKKTGVKDRILLGFDRECGTAASGMFEDGTRIVTIGPEFEVYDKAQQEAILLHEVGHLYHDHGAPRKLIQEIEADRYSANLIGEGLMIRTLSKTISLSIGNDKCIEELTLRVNALKGIEVDIDSFKYDEEQDEYEGEEEFLEDSDWLNVEFRD